MSKIQVNMHEAKSKLSQLAEKVWEGHTVIIAKSGKPYLDLLPHRPQKKRVAGRYKNKVKISKAFNETPLSIIEEFEGLS